MNLNLMLNQKKIIVTDQKNGLNKKLKVTYRKKSGNRTDNEPFKNKPPIGGII